MAALYLAIWHDWHCDIGPACAYFYSVARPAVEASPYARADIERAWRESLP